MDHNTMGAIYLLSRLLTLKSCLPITNFHNSFICVHPTNIRHNSRDELNKMRKMQVSFFESLSQSKAKSRQFFFLSYGMLTLFLINFDFKVHFIFDTQNANMWELCNWNRCSAITYIDTIFVGQWLK